MDVHDPVFFKRNLRDSRNNYWPTTSPGSSTDVYRRWKKEPRDTFLANGGLLEVVIDGSEARPINNSFPHLSA